MSTSYFMHYVVETQEATHRKRLLFFNQIIINTLRFKVKNIEYIDLFKIPPELQLQNCLIFILK